MKDHRIRLTDQQLSLVVSALRARLAMQRGARRLASAQLIERLEEGGRGNPAFRFSWESEADRAERMSQSAAAAR